MAEFYKNRRFWVTGASSGIGRAVALELLSHGALVALTSRRTGPLEELARQSEAEDRCLVVPADLTSRNANIQAVNRIKEAWGGLDVAFLNAGSCIYVDVKKFEAETFEKMIQTNFLSMVYGIEAALPELRQSSSPHLVGMSSTVAYTGLPTSEAYGASKAAIRAMFESLSLSLRPEGIAVSVICPGFVETPLTDLNDFPMPMRISAEEAARCIVRGMKRRNFEIDFPLRFSLMLKLISAMPEPLRQLALKGTVRKS